MSCLRCLVVVGVGMFLSRGSLLAAPPESKGGARVDAAGDLLPQGALARLGTLRLRHQGEAFVSFSPDGKQLISVGADNALAVWSLPDGHKVRSFRRPGVKFAVARANANERVAFQMLLAQGGRGGIPAQLLRQQSALLGLQSVAAVAVACSADGRWLACAGAKNGLNIWDTTAGMQPQHLDGQMFVTLAFAPDARLLAAGELEGETFVVRVWDRAAGRQVWKLKTQAGSVPQALRFSPDGKYLASREPNFVRLWSMASGKRARLYATQHEILDAVFSPDCKFVAAVTNNHTVVIWETASEEEVGTLALAENTIQAACFSMDGSGLFTWSDDGLFRLWSCRQEKELRRWEGPSAGIQSLALAPDGKMLAAATVEGVITLWDPAAGKQVGPARPPEVRTLAFTSPDTLFLYTADGEARWVDWASGKVRRCAARPFPKGTVITASGQERVSAWGEEDHLNVVDARTGKVLAKVEGIETLAGMGFAPGGGLAAFYFNDETLRLWDLAKGKETRRLEIGPAVQVAFAHDGKTLAVLGADQEMHLWELATGQLRSQFPATQSDVRVLEFTPDDRFLVAACADESVRVWDALTGKRVRSLVGHFGPIEALAVSPDSKRLASGGADGVVRIWDLGSGAELRRLKGHRGPINALAFAADGKRLASASKDTTVLVWDLTAPAAKVAVSSRRPAAVLWEDLGRADAAVAFRAMAELVSNPEEAIALFRTRLAPTPPVQAKHVEQLIANLNDARYAVREKATRALEKLGGRARPFLVKALQAKTPREAAKRLHDLVIHLDVPAREPDALRAQRAVEVLERIGTPVAMQLLGDWGKGAPGSRLTQSALDARERVSTHLAAKTP